MLGGCVYAKDEPDDTFPCGSRPNKRPRFESDLTTFHGVTPYPDCYETEAPRLSLQIEVGEKYKLESTIRKHTNRKTHRTNVNW